MGFLKDLERRARHAKDRAVDDVTGVADRAVDNVHDAIDFVGELDPEKMLTNYLTFGVLDSFNLNEDGSMDLGYLAHGANEFLGEITGRNMQRGMMRDANDRFEAERLDLAEKLRESREQDFLDDVSASRLADNSGLKGGGRRGIRRLGRSGSPRTEGDLLGLS